MARSRLRNGEQTVPAAPFSRWLRERINEIETLAGAQTPAERVAVGASQKLADELGWGGNEAGVRRVYRYKNERSERTAGGQARKTRWAETAETWIRAEVEDACHRVNPDLFYELYPELQHERMITLEPDAWCPCCRTCEKHPHACPKGCRHPSGKKGQWVTPIDGLCPWCVCEHGHLFREVGVTEDGFACLECLKEERRARQRVAHRARYAAKKEAA